MRGVRAGNHRLGRNAAGVDASAAEKLAFDNSDLPAAGGKTTRQRGAGLPRSDNESVESYKLILVP